MLRIVEHLIGQPGFDHHAALHDDDAVRQQAAGLCARFAGGVHLLVIYPSAQDLPGMERIADRFGVLDICGVQPA